ncbi:transketolase C-terminal domain-containing protein [Mycoplasma sp. ATU-Cv-508]|uniref:transketolase C-terminal domain-containing protein n=1 Tax=Mycoplasma sp. ATU-Cv-508 TaxID=2048001 RepID=UPI0013750519
MLDEIMLDPHETLDLPTYKQVELSQPLEENPRYIQLTKKARYAFDQNGQEVSALRQYQIRDAIFEAVAQEATEQSSLIVYGQEHRDWGGAYAVWRGLTELLPYHRFFNTMIGEAAIVGSAVGYALCGGRAVVEIMYFDFLFRAGDEIANQMAKWRAMSGGTLNVPLVLRVLIGATYGAQHSQDYTSVIAHIPGLKLVQPATPYDAKGLMTSALRESNPVVFVETQNLYGMGEKFVKTGVPSQAYAIKIGAGVIRRVGQDITIVTLGSALYPALEAAEELAKRWKISAEVIDARSAVPFDYDIVLKSLKKTGQIVLVNNGAERNNFMRHVASTLSELAFDELDAPPVVLGARNWIMPGAGLDRWIYPQSENILAAIHAKITPLADFRPERHETSVELYRRNKQGV